MQYAKHISKINRIKTRVPSFNINVRTRGTHYGEE